MAETLYRKYRPQTFDGLAGQQHIRITLANEISTQKLAHAYLFSGPRGVGKTTTARIFAKAVNCQNRKPNESEPCNECEACREITAGQSLDLIEIDAASHTGVDNVRDNIIENARFTPARWPYKVFIIDEIHMLSAAAFNALLKTLEEPPAHAIFILCTTELHKLPETIISRCQRFDFRKIARDDLFERLKRLAKSEGKEVVDEVLYGIIRLAEGSSRDAESLLGQVLTVGEKKITAELAQIVLPRSHADAVMKLIECVVRRDITGALETINTLAEEGVNFVQFSHELVDWLRLFLLIKAGGNLSGANQFELSADQDQALRALIPEIEMNRLVAWINALLDRERDIKNLDIPQLPLELIVIEACSLDAPRTESDQQPPAVPPAATPTESKSADTPTRSATKSSGHKMELSEIQTRWPEILQKVQQENQPLALVLKLARPGAIRDGKLILHCQYPIHAERLKHLGTRQAIESVLETVLGEAWSIDADVVASDELSDADIVSPLLETFGGEVVG
ncbi:MAG: DNA polymerase III subunit gamma/tau [Patescibacteria group bacterium]|jgi:DNA polymerase-3 subunit gamma/tau